MVIFMLNTFRATERACYAGYITQAIGINFIPLLYLYFTKEYGVSLSQISVLSGMMFWIQLMVDMLSAKAVDKIGYRKCAVGAHICAAAGIGGLGILPGLLRTPFLGVVLSVIVFAAGCGMIEVIISPIVQGCPSRQKAASMGFLHSFYCWGQAGVILISTVVFMIFGLSSWKYLALIWALIPAVNAYVFLKVPINLLVESGQGMSLRELCRRGIFWCMIILMICAGASEMAVAQWASAFAEAGLNVSKNIGDIAGPCFFAVLMGTSRVIYSKYSLHGDMKKYMVFSAVLCIAGYIMTACQPNAVISLLGCGVCGFAVGAMWPGTYSMAAQSCPRGGTELFAMLALAGDIGCTAGVSVVGFMSELFNNNLKIGIVCAAVFPVIMLVIIGRLITKK